MTTFLWFKFSKKEALFFALTVLLDAFAILISKDIVQKNRPTNGLIYVPGFSFPSGHTAIVVVFFGLLVYLLMPKIKSYLFKNTLVLGSILIILFVGFTRVYLNVHWLTDVIGGLALGMFVLTGSIFLRDTMSMQ